MKVSEGVRRRLVGDDVMEPWRRGVVDLLEPWRRGGRN